MSPSKPTQLPIRNQQSASKYQSNPNLSSVAPTSATATTASTTTGSASAVCGGTAGGTSSAVGLGIEHLSPVKSNVVSSHVNIYCSNSSSANQTSSASSSSSKSPRSRSPPPPMIVTSVAPPNSSGGRSSVIRLNRGPSQPVSLSFVETTSSLDRNINRHSRPYEQQQQPAVDSSPSSSAPAQAAQAAQVAAAAAAAAQVASSAAANSQAYPSEFPVVDICSSSYCCQITPRCQYTTLLYYL